MATGASTADAAVVLIDATKGVLRQSRRHAYIAHLLGVQHIVAAVNKMDLVGFSQEVFDRIAAEFREFAEQLGISNVYAVPVSALEGDNVVRSQQAHAVVRRPAAARISRNDSRRASAQLRVRCVFRCST